MDPVDMLTMCHTKVFAGSLNWWCLMIVLIGCKGAFDLAVSNFGSTPFRCECQVLRILASQRDLLLTVCADVNHRYFRLIYASIFMVKHRSKTGLPCEDWNIQENHRFTSRWFSLISHVLLGTLPFQSSPECKYLCVEEPESHSLFHSVTQFCGPPNYCSI